MQAPRPTFSWYAPACAVLALGLGAQAVELGPPFTWPLAWGALTCALLALGYAGLGAFCLPKRPDGRHRPAAWLLAGPYLAVARAAWWAIARFGAEDACNEVAPGLWVGRRPRAAEVPAGVAHVVDLTAEFPAAAGVGDGRRYTLIPMLDGTAPPADPELVAALAAEPGGVLIHCAQGHGRSAALAGAVLIARGLATGAADAEARMQAARPGIGLNGAQRRYVDWYAGVARA